jgi:hypothetical protein
MVQAFICDSNENDFMKGIQPESFHWNSCHFGEGRNRKFYNPARIVTEMLSTRLCFIKRYEYTKLVLGNLFSE